MSISNREFSKRRKDLMSQMESNSIAILASALPSIRNNDAEYQYRQDSDFLLSDGAC
jgi:Xaa-Pro aminopeptidase